MLLLLLLRRLLAGELGRGLAAATLVQLDTRLADPQPLGARLGDQLVPVPGGLMAPPAIAAGAAVVFAG